MKTSSRIQLLSACLGNLFEHYDTALFGLLSPFLAPLIFPKHDPVTALILTYAIIPLGMLARPIGSLVFGYIGDVYGRKQALFFTLAGMSIVSLGIAFTPTYSQIGLFAPLIFCLGRALQNFLSAGESMGGAIYLLENTPEKKHDILSGLYNASTMAGHFLASFGIFLLGRANWINPGWRLLYLAGCITALFGCMIRGFSSQELAPSPKPLLKLRQTLWEHRKSLLFIVICAGFGSACFSMALVLMNGFIPLISPLSKTEIMKINTYLLILDFCALPFFGWVASKISREKLMLIASSAVFLFSIPLTLSLKEGSLAAVVGVRIAFVLCGVAFFAPFHAWASRLIPSNSRYAVISLGYAIGSQAIGSPTAAFALWCFQKTGMVSSVAWYWTFLALVSSGIILSGILSKTQTLRSKTNG